MMIHDSDSDEDSDVLLDLTKLKDQEERLLPQNGHGGKFIGNTWGRLKNIMGCSNYPKTVFLILGTEFCERFNYYGMRTILVLYLTEWLGLAYHSAVAVYHMFSMLAYFSPLFGAIIADGYLGRYRAILYISIVYAAGTLIVALTAFPPPEIYGPVIGLLLISLGTGGIKPCVSAFGGDQFSSHQEKEQMTFFSAFYFMINLGSMISTFLTPVLRADVHCIEDSCYPLAFGVPTILMIISIVIFVIGKNYYKHVPPTGNLFGRVICCIMHGAQMRIKHGKKEKKDSHWLDYATDKYEESFVADLKAVLRVLWLFLPLPLFWALFDQQGSRWTLQAVDMDGDIGSLGRIKPDQLQVLNPLLILLLIPVFEKLVFPCLNRFRIPNRPLQRMALGMAFCSLAFVIAGLVQLKNDQGKESPLANESGVTFLNTVNCTITLQSSVYSTPSLPTFQASPYIKTSLKDSLVSFYCSGEKNTSYNKFPLQMKTNEAYRVVIHETPRQVSTEMSIFTYPDLRNKDTNGKATLSLINFLPSLQNLTVLLKPFKNEAAQEHGTITITVSENEASSFTTVEPGRYQLFVPDQSFNTSYITIEPVLTFGSGSVQSVVLQAKVSDESQSLQFSALQFRSLKRNEISMAWMIPQYLIITVGEILFSITGLSFAYSQAPKTMKSILQAAWLLSTAVGDLIVVIVAQTQLMPSQSSEFFMFASVMALDTVLFAILANLYKSRPVNDERDEEVDTATLVSRSPSENSDVPLQEISPGKPVH